jgi:ADP-ribose pyrophosphatase YjhB (NUDIX family)
VIEKVRAVLLTPGGGMLTIRRVWPGGEPFWVLPGGHVEPDDPTLPDALRREVLEETGGKADIVGVLCTLQDERKRQHIYLARIDAWSEEGRTGPEFTDPDRGDYFLEEVPLTADGLSRISLYPDEVAAMLRGAVVHGRDLVELVT